MDQTEAAKLRGLLSALCVESLYLPKPHTQQRASSYNPTWLKADS